MPNYQTHSRVGQLVALIGGAAVGFGTWEYLNADPMMAVILGAGTSVVLFMGSIFPDVDHPQSIPFRRTVTLLRVGVVGGAVGLFVWRDALLATAQEMVASALPAGVPPLYATGGLILAGAVAVALMVPSVLDAVTGEHRTWTHSLTVMGVFAAVGGAALYFTLPTVGFGNGRLPLAAGLPAVFFIGVTVHVALDSF